MYGNNFGGPFMMPNMTYGSMMGGFPTMGGAPIMRNASMIGGTRGGGLSSLLGLGRRSGNFLAGTRSFNLAGLLNNASKTLGVVNQAIPIFKEVGPMLGNMRSMLKIASVFKDETDSNIRNTTKQNTTLTNENIITKENNNLNKTSNTKKNDTSISSTTVNQLSFNNEPNFFL